METTETPQKLEMFYEGKAKKLYSTSDPDLVIAYFKDDATAFDGTKRDTIADKGVVNNRMSELFFTMLEEHGVRTAIHTLALCDVHKRGALWTIGAGLRCDEATGR